ncbi:MAG: CDP-alcohol phosphatidyltransferase family protein, partial [Chlamydiia bacterium]|nr:CDP-alcohol phosphatidyltransferase family protein [Chlamydiia bacterium]
MLENAVRPKFDQLLFKPLARALVKLRISPLGVTGTATLAGVAVLPLASFGFSALAVLFLWLSGLFDVLDGAVARLTNRTTDAGAALDIISDRLVESAVILGLYLGAPEERALLSLLMLSSILLCVTSFLVVGIFSQNDSLKSFHYSPGLMERAEAF